ncbi:hypothetical protein GCM10027037_28570 [Mucilaginibacter koreensis]|jgi:ArsR family transcriptional regulator
MAKHKKSEFTAADQRLSDTAKALSHPARITIMRLLASHPGFTCGEIVDVLPLAQPTVSRHLKELQIAGLITVAFDGKRSLYEINWNNWNQGAAEFTTLLGLAPVQSA